MSTEGWLRVPRRWRLVAIAITIALLIETGAALAPDPDVSARPVEGQRRRTRPVIVTVAPGANPRAVARQLGIEPDLVYSHAINGFAARIPKQAMSALSGAPAVVTITPDQTVRAYAEPEANRKKKKKNRKRKQKQQRIPSGVNRIDAERSGLAAIGRDGGAIDIDVAVLDTGIAAHRDLTIAGGKACIGRGGHGDGDGHGTHVAGTIAARDNNRGVVGVAPGARLWAVKVLNDNGVGSFSSLICGLDYVAANAGVIDVVNMSLGATSYGQSSCWDGGLHEAVCNVVERGVPVVVAAGNEQRSATNSVPARYPEVIAVSALADFDGRPGGRGKRTCRRDQDDSFASFSNYGPAVDIMAPGVCIRSTYKGKGYATMSGTSMAAPHVAGAVALYRSVNPAATPEDVLDWLLSPAGSRPQGDAAHGLARRDAPNGSTEPLLYLGDT